MAVKRRTRGAQIARGINKAMFVEAYIAHRFNGRKAMVSLGAPPRSAAVFSSRFLKDPEVIALIKAKQNATLEKMKLTSDEVLESLTRAIRFDPRKLFDAEGKLKKIHDLDDDTALELEDFEISVKRGIKVGFPKKHGAREQAMRFFGMFAKDKQGARPEDDETPPATSITIDFKDARRKK